MKPNTFLITRPTHQSAELIATIEKNGDICVSLPCIDISPPTDQQSIEFAITHFDQFDYCIFTSSNAVLAQFKNLLASYEKALVAIGPATATSLSAYAKNGVIMPQEYSSEGLLALPSLQHVAGLTVAVFTGENPKPLLMDTLRSRGALVKTITCYKRSCPPYTPEHIHKITQTDYVGIITTSKEAFDNLITLFEHHSEWLKKQPLVVISESMATAAKTYGFQTITITDVSIASYFG